MVYSTMIGTGQQLPKGIVVDDQGNAYIAGLSADAGLKTVNAFQSTYGGGLCTTCTSPFFAKLNPTGTAFVFASYFSGPHNAGINADTYASAIARDAHGNIYLAGPGDGVPLQGSFQNGIGGSFVAEFGPDGKTLIFSTMLGGSTIQTDYLTGMQVGPDGTIYLAGSQSAQDFPYTTQALMHPIYFRAETSHLVAIAINPAHTGFTYATYLGEGFVSSTAMDASGNFYIGGTFGLSSVPLKNALVSDVGGGAFILELDSTGALVNSTAFGGYNVSEPPAGMAIDANGNIYAAGAPNIGGGSNIPSGSFLDPISVGTGSNYSDQADLGLNTSFIKYSTIVTKISPANLPQVSLSYQGPALELRNVGSADLHISSLQVGGTFTKANSTCGSTVTAGIACFLTPNNDAGNATNGTVTINSDASPASQTFTPAPSSTGISSNVSLFVDTSHLSFPPQANGGVSPSRPLRIWNTGLTSTTIQSILTFGSFHQTNDCSTLAPQTFCTVQVSVAPPVGGGSTGSPDIGIVYLVSGNSIRDDVFASFTQNLTDGPLLLSANGYGLNYGNVLVGQTSIIRTLTVTNTGNIAVSAADPTIAGTGAGSFLVAANSCSGISLQPQQSCIVSVQFQPSSTGRVAVPMTISGGGYSNNVELVGTGIAVPLVSITPNSGALGNILLGSSASQTFQVTNTGTASETLSNIVATLADASFSTEYAEQDTCQAPFAPLATCSITVTLTPQSAGVRNGALHLSVNGGIVSQSVPITATAITVFSASPGSIDFGPLLVGGPGKTVPVVFTNQTGAPQPFTMAVGSGFQLSTTSCVSPLAAGAQCTASVSFQPASPGPQQAALTVSFANSPASVSVNLTGVGTIQPSIQFSVANHTYGDPSFTVAATSNSTGTISYSVVSGPATVSGSTVTLQGVGTVILQATQAAAGNYTSGTQNATFTVASAPPNFSVSANVSSLTIKQGQSGTATLTVTPLNGFNAAVSFSCSGLPSGASCSFSPASITPSGGPATSQVTVTTLAPMIATNGGGQGRTSFWRKNGGSITIAVGFIFWLIPFRRRRGEWKGLALWILLAGMALLPAVGCGGSQKQTTIPGTPVGADQVTVSTTNGAGSGALQHDVVLTVNVTN